VAITSAPGSVYGERSFQAASTRRSAGRSGIVRVPVRKERFTDDRRTRSLEHVLGVLAGLEHERERCPETRLLEIHHIAMVAARCCSCRTRS
jgi:hypothetical protein